jgi:hypothetical protein
VSSRAELVMEARLMAMSKVVTIKSKVTTSL